MKTKICSKCQTDKPLTEYYHRPDRKDKVQSYCKNCFNIYCIERWVKKKKQAIEYKGNVCEDCRGKFEYFLYDFHHLDPSVKDVDWTKLRLRSWFRIKKELDKCVLLCCMCHRRREHYL